MKFGYTEEDELDRQDGAYVLWATSHDAHTDSGLRVPAVIGQRKQDDERNQEGETKP
jgi:hypothetical protein